MTGINKIIFISFELVPLDIATSSGNRTLTHRKHAKEGNWKKEIINTE